MHPKANRLALLVALSYVIVGIGWDLASDALLKAFVSGADARIYLDIIKDAGFIVFTGVLLYLVVGRLLTKMAGSERRHRDLFEHMNEGVAHCRMIFENDRPMDFIYVAVNEKFTRLTGLNDVVGKRATEVIPGIRENDPDLLLIYGRVAATGKPEQVERYVTSLAMWFALSVYRTEPGFFVVVFDVITARKRAEAALRESEAKFSIMFNSNPVPMSLSSVKAGRVLDVNTAWLDLYDWPRDQVVGQTLFGLNLWADLEQRAVLFARLREQGGLHNAEIEHRSKSGRHIHVLWSGINMVVGGEQCLLCSAMDITRHKQTEAARLESETRFRKLLEKAPFALCHSSNAGAITFRNERFLGLFGHTPEEVPDVESWMLRAYPDPQYRAWVMATWEAAVRQATEQDRDIDPKEYRVTCKAGEERTVEIAGITFDDGVLVTFRDLTSSKRAEAALRESEEKYRGLFEGAQDAIVTADPATGRFISGNPAALRLFGVKNEAEFIAHGPADFSPERQPDGRLSAEAAREVNEKMLQGASRFFEWTHRRNGGEEFIADVLLTRLERGGKALVLATIRDITARKRAEAEMSLQFSALTAAANAIMITDRIGKIKWVNPAFTRLTGYSAAEAIGCNPRLLNSGAHPPALYANLWATILTGNIWQGELINRRKDGQLYTEDMTITPVREADGQIAHFVAIKQDITSRKHTERLLEFVAQEGWDGKQEDFLARLVQYLGVILAVDYVFIGRREEGENVQTTGLYAKGRIVPDIKYSTRGAPCANVIGKTLCHYREKLQELFPEDRLLVEMGAQSYLGIPLKDSAGQPLGLMAILDSKPLPEAQLAAALLQIASVRVSGEIERRAKAEELRWKTALMEAQVEAAPDGILVVDHHAQRILQNRRMNELWKIPPEIVANPTDSVQIEFVTSRTKNPGIFAERIVYLNSRRDEISRDEVELIDGTILDRYSSPVWDKAGNYYGRIWTFRDITKSRLMESQLRQAQKMEAIGTLAGGIAHDFNNILAAMFGYGYLLQQDTEGNVAAQESIEQIMKSATRAKDLVQQILTFSRQREQKRQVIPLDTVVKEATKFLRASLPADIRIEMNLSASAPTVLADPTQIYQVTMNLATNALHAMEGRGGRLTVNLESFQPDENFIRTHLEFRPVQYALLTVADTGHGMDASTLERIFDPFFTTKPVGKGTGLGLAVVHGIIKSHEGIIDVQSVVGQGTTFQIYLPAQTNGVAATAVSHVQTGKGHGQKILLLDDEPAVTVPFQRLLQRLGYEVTICNSAREAVGFVRENSARFDLVITDLTMPEMSGLELARQLHDLRPDLPVILSSGFTPDLNREELRAAGICELLEKPVTMTALQDVLQRTLVKPELRSE